MAAEFRILGEVQAFVNGQSVDLGHRRQQSVLVILLLDANRSVHTDELIERVWGARLPYRARHQCAGAACDGEG